MGNVQSIANVAAIQALTSPATDVLQTLGYSSAGDGGALTYVLKASDTTSADNGCSIIVDASGNRWYGVFDDFILPQMAGAKADGSTDDTAAVTRAVTAALATGIGVKFKGFCKVTSQITVSPKSGLPSGRGTFLRLTGDHYSMSGITYTGASECLKVASGTDGIMIDNMSCNTTSGGFLQINGDCGGFHVDRFFMNGCAASCWAFNFVSGTVYTGNIDNSRFWYSTGYAGGVLAIANGINVAIRNTFISQQTKNGDIVSITNCKGFHVDTVQFETPTTTAVSSIPNQVYVNIHDYCFDVVIDNAYFEGNVVRGIVVGGATRTCRIRAPFSLNAAPYSVLVDAPGPNNTALSVEGLVYASSATAGPATISSCTHSGTTATVVTATAHNLLSGLPIVRAGADVAAFNGSFTATVVNSTTFTYTMASTPASDPAVPGAYDVPVVNDPNNLCTLSGYANNATTGPQTSRVSKLNPETQEASGKILTAVVSSGSAISVGLQLPSLFGRYNLVVGIQTGDNNHGIMTEWRVGWNAGHSFNITNCQQVGTTQSWGTVPPTSPGLSVSSGGLVSIGATSATSQTYNVFWYWKKTAALN